MIGRLFGAILPGDFALAGEAVGVFGRSLLGTPIASSNSANSTYVIFSHATKTQTSRLTFCMIPPVASLCPLAKSSPTRSLNPGIESPYSLSSSIRFATISLTRVFYTYVFLHLVDSLNLLLSDKRMKSCSDQDYIPHLRTMKIQLKTLLMRKNGLL